MTTKHNASSITAKVIVWMFVLAAAALSAHDIVTLFERIGAPRPPSFLPPSSSTASPGSASSCGRTR